MDQPGKVFSLSEPVSGSLENALAVKLQPVDDLVDHLALGAHRQLDQIELGGDHRPRRLAVTSSGASNSESTMPAASAKIWLIS
jgi:hypothetical protein